MNIFSCLNIISLTAACLIASLFSKSLAWAHSGLISTEEEATQFIQKRKWNDAIQILRPLFKAEPHSISIAVDLATALAHVGEREEALNLLTPLVERVKGNQRLALLRRIRALSCLFLTNKTFQVFQDGMNLFLMKKYRSSRERFEKALSVERDNIEVVIRLGQSLVLDSMPEKAMEYFKTALRLNPYELEAKLWLGRILYLKGNSTNAVSELRGAFDQLAGSELASVWLAEALNASGQVNAALRILDHDIKTSPLHVMSLLTAARLRVQTPHANSQVLWLARKNTQLAMSRLPEYFSHLLSRREIDLSLDPFQSESEVMAEAQRLMQLVEIRLAEITSDRSR